MFGHGFFATDSHGEGTDPIDAEKHNSSSEAGAVSRKCVRFNPRFFAFIRGSIEATNSHGNGTDPMDAEETIAAVPR